MLVCYFLVFFFFKQKTAYEMRISDWSSDVCSSDLAGDTARRRPGREDVGGHVGTGELAVGQECEGGNGDADLGHLEIAGEGPPHDTADHRQHVDQIGRASCRERVCTYV